MGVKLGILTVKKGIEAAKENSCLYPKDMK
jgi:hypothetical protein